MQNTIQKNCLIEVLNFVISRGANRLILLSDIKCKFAVSHAKTAVPANDGRKILYPPYISIIEYFTNSNIPQQLKHNGYNTNI